MKTAVRYYSKSGNTKLLAEAVGSAVGVSAEPVSEPLAERTEILFLGSSVYAGTPDPEVIGFIRSNASRIGRVVLFGSSASGKSTYSKIKTAAETEGVPVNPEYFFCPGKFLFMHKGRPNESDLTSVAEFAAKFADN